MAQRGEKEGVEHQRASRGSREQPPDSRRRPPGVQQHCRDKEQRISRMKTPRAGRPKACTDAAARAHQEAEQRQREVRIKADGQTSARCASPSRPANSARVPARHGSVKHSRPGPRPPPPHRVRNRTITTPSRCDVEYPASRHGRTQRARRHRCGLRSAWRLKGKRMKTTSRDRASADARRARRPAAPGSGRGPRSGGLQCAKMDSR